MDSILTVSFQRALIESFANPVNKSGRPLEHLLGDQGKASFVEDLLRETVAIAHVLSASFDIQTENSHFLQQFSHL
jgi:hypothetical protein